MQTFAASYTSDSFTDDVLAFKAVMLLDKNHIDEAQAVLEQIINDHPNGDMIHRAYFLKTFYLAKTGQTTRAIETFNKLRSRKHQAIFGLCISSVLWSARLAIFSDLTKLNNKKSNPEAIKSLIDLTVSQNPNVYFWLAQSLLELLQEKVPAEKTKEQTEELTLKQLSENPVLSLVDKLVRYGFRDEALILLKGIQLIPTDLKQAHNVAIYYDVLNRPEAGHQKLVRCQWQFQTLASEMPKTFARISYPYPFAFEITQALQKIPA